MALGVSSQKYASIMLLLVIIFVSLAMGNMSMFSGRGGGRGGLGMSENARFGMNSQGVYAGGAVSAGYQENMKAGAKVPPKK